MPRLRLVSDFRDYYDYAFDEGGVDVWEFRRCLTLGPPRPSQLELISTRLGGKTPPHGSVRQIAANTDAEDVVIYLPDYVHNGLGLVRLPAQYAAKTFPHLYCTAYIGGHQGLTYRALQVGDRGFLLSYYSSDDWRSNRGNVDVKILQAYDAKVEIGVPYTLWAVDFVADHPPEGNSCVEALQNPSALAFDFNVAPGLMGVGLEDILSPTEAVHALRRSWKAIYAL